jgi:hypothetical protein
MRFETLLAFVRKGRVKPKSVVRGPTTHQLWKFAAHVKGLSREFGLCYSCGSAIETSAKLCPQCNHLQEPPPNPDVLLESGKEAVSPAVVAPPAGPAAPAAGRGPAAHVHREPSLEAGDADFVVPTLGGGSDDSLAGFSLAGSMAGVTVNPEWARIESPASRARPPRPGVEAPGAQAYSAPPRPAPRPRPMPGDSVAGYPAVSGSPSAGNGDRRRREREPEGGFLSAKDLAAAFKLDFGGDVAPAPEPASSYPAAGAAPQAARVPAHGYPQPHAPVQPRGQAPSSIPVALRQPVRRRRRYGVLKVLLVLLVTCGALYGAAVWIDEGFRRDSFAWFARLKASLTESLRGSRGRQPAPAGGAGAASKPAAPGASGGAAAMPPRPADDAAAPSQYSRFERDPFEDRRPELASPNVGPATKPAAATTKPAGLAMKSAAPGTRPVAGDPGRAQPGLPLVPRVPEAQTSFVSPPSTAPAEGNAGSQIAAAELRMWELYRAAYALERTDAGKAAETYRAIKALPRQVWPTDLDICIRRAEETHRARHPGG